MDQGTGGGIRVLLFVTCKACPKTCRPYVLWHSGNLKYSISLENKKTDNDS